MKFKTIPASVRKGWELSDEAALWTELLGPDVPEDVKRLRRTDDGGFLLASPQALLAAPNSFAEVVRLGREARQTEPVLQALTNSYFFASLPHEGDCLLHHSPPLTHAMCNGRETADVVYWCHETGLLHHAEAYDLPTVARLLEVADSSDDEAARVERLKEALGRYSLDRWPLSHIGRFLEEDGLIAAVDSVLAEKKRKGPVKPPKTAFAVLHDRAVWLAAALASDVVNKAAVAAQHAWQPDETMAQPGLFDYPPTALYWLVRSFVLGEDERFERVAAAAVASQSRLVRDAVVYLRESGDVFSALRARAAEVLDEITNPFPKAMSLGGATLRRDDAVAPVPLASPEPLAIVEPAADLLLEARWHQPKLVVPIDDRHLIVSGNHKHPRAGKDGSIPNWLPALMEVDRETGAGRILCSLPHGGFESTQGDLLGAQLLTAGPNHLRRFERHGDRLWLVDEASSAQSRALVVARGEDHVVVAYGGSQRMGPSGWEDVVDSIELWGIVDGALARLGSAPLALASVAARQDEVVGASLDGTAGYRLEGLDEALADWRRPGVTFRRSYFRERDDNPTVTPTAISTALGDMDLAIPTDSGSWLVLKKQGGDPLDALFNRPSVYSVQVGDETGVRPVAPELTGIGVFDVMRGREAMACIDGKLYCIDLPTGEVKATFALPEGVRAVEVLSDGYCIVVGEELVFWDATGRETRRIHTGAGAATLMGLYGGGYVALRTADTPLVLLEIDGDTVRLAGAARPDGPLAQAQFSTPARPPGHYRLFATLDRRLYQPFGLRRGAGTEVGDSLPSAPWAIADIGLEQG